MLYWNPKKPHKEGRATNQKEGRATASKKWATAPKWKAKYKSTERRNGQRRRRHSLFWKKIYFSIRRSVGVHIQLHEWHITKSPAMKFIGGVGWDWAYHQHSATRKWPQISKGTNCIGRETDTKNHKELWSSPAIQVSNVAGKENKLTRPHAYLIPTTFLKSASRARTMYLWKLNFGFPLQCVYSRNKFSQNRKC